MSRPFDYNRMPLAPMGYKVQVHKKTDKQGTWVFHSIQHKDIINPTTTPYDKIMLALADCAKAIKGINNIGTSQDIRGDIQCISQLNDRDNDDLNDP